MKSNKDENKAGDNTLNPEANTSHSSKKDPQGTSMGMGSQPAAVKLDKGEGNQSDKPDNPDGPATKSGKDEGNTKTPGYGSSNNAAGI